MSTFFCTGQMETRGCGRRKAADDVQTRVMGQGWKGDEEQKKKMVDGCGKKKHMEED
jgi:hypothetical protein